MLFNSIEFLFFLPIVFLLYWFVFKPLKWQNLLVVIVSYIFYGWWDWRFLLLIAFTSFCSFISGILIERFCHQRSIQKNISTANIVINLLILCIFKYYNFFIDSLKDVLFEAGGGRIGLADNEYYSSCRHQFLYISGIELFYRRLSR